MMQKQFARLFFVVVSAVLIGTFALSLLFSGPTPFDWAQDAQAAPPAAPTPVADVIFGVVQPSAINFQSTTAIIADTNTTGIDVMKFSGLDVQYVIDHGTVNTATLTVQYSNDNVNWVSGAVLVSSSAVDGTSITRVPVFGKWVRINQDITGVDPLTVTLTAVGR